MRGIENDVDSMPRGEDGLYGALLANELKQRGINPWDMRTAATAYISDLGIPDTARLTIRGSDDMRRGGGFQGWAMPPYDPNRATITINRNLSPEEQLLALRHEMQHAADYSKLLGTMGVGAFDRGAPKSVFQPQHFMGGSQPDVERQIIDASRMRGLIGR